MENSNVEEMYELLGTVESNLYEVLGIVRMIGDIEIPTDPEKRLHALESATWAGRAAESIISRTIDLMED